MAIQSPLLSIFNAAINAVSGRNSVIQTLRSIENFTPDLIISVGKAAGDMYLGAHAWFGPEISAVIATKHQHFDYTLDKHPKLTVIEAGHPIPDQNSLRAGQTLLDHVSAMDEHSKLLLLVSGGASAIAECLPEDMTLSDWQNLNAEMISSGLNIEQINTRRKTISLIKDGRLLDHFSGKRVIVCAISDVQGDNIATIGSGIGDVYRSLADSEVYIVASNLIAREAAANEAIKLGFEVKHNRETLYGDVHTLANTLGATLRSAEKGIYIWGGEPTIELPDNPGNGGRNQSLALALAKEIRGREDISILVAGTDGSDGPTDATGAIVDGSTFRYPEQAQTALDEANAGDYLEILGQRLITGPTGTNVMDLVIASVR